MSSSDIRRALRAGTFVALGVAAAGPARAQAPEITCERVAAAPNSFSMAERYLCLIVARIREDRGVSNTATLDINRDSFSIAMILADRKRQQVVAAAEEAEDDQVGGGPANAGSTSLVVKGGTPWVLGLAVENGALTQSQSGTTLTFRGTPVGIVKALANKGFIQGYDEDRNREALKLLARASFSVSFDASRGTQAGAPMFTGDRQQLSAYSVRYEVVNRRDPRDRSYELLWRDFAEGEGTIAAAGVDAFNRAVLDDNTNTWREKQLQQWFETTRQALAAAPTATLEQAVRERFKVLPSSDLSEGFNESLTGFQRAIDRLVASQNALVQRIQQGPLVTLEYTANRPIAGPTLGNVRLIAEIGGGINLTGNASVTLYQDTIPSTASGRVRDVQASAEAAIPLGDVGSIGRFTLAFAGKYERLRDDVTGPTGTPVPNTKGDIAIGQIKLTIPMKGSGVKVPISITFANRTELIKEKEVRGNVGLTFDFDTLFARLKP